MHTFRWKCDCLDDSWFWPNHRGANASQWVRWSRVYDGGVGQERDTVPWLGRKTGCNQKDWGTLHTCILNAVCLSGAINFVVQLRAFMCTCVMWRFSQFCRKYNLRKVLFLALRWRHLSVVSMTGSHVLVGAATASTSSSVRCVMPHHPVHETEEFCTRGHVTVHCIRRQNLCPVWSSVLRGGLFYNLQLISLFNWQCCMHLLTDLDAHQVWQTVQTIVLYGTGCIMQYLWPTQAITCIGIFKYHTL